MDVTLPKYGFEARVLDLALPTYRLERSTRLTANIDTSCPNKSSSRRMQITSETSTNTDMHLQPLSGQRCGRNGIDMSPPGACKHRRHFLLALYLHISCTSSCTRGCGSVRTEIEHAGHMPTSTFVHRPATSRSYKVYRHHLVYQKLCRTDLRPN